MPILKKDIKITKIIIPLIFIHFFLEKIKIIVMMFNKIIMPISIYR